jgi:glucan phosphoethanolaminetransferase (alkaline phosphatase superfamily)
MAPPLPDERMPPAARYRLYVLGTLYCAPYVAMLVWGWQTYEARSILTLLLTMALGLLLLGILTRTWRRFFLVYVPFLLVSGAYAAYSLSFGVVPGHTLAIVLVSASWEELQGLWSVWQGKWLLLPSLAFLGLYLWLAWSLPQRPIFSGQARIATRVFLALALPVTAFAAQNARQLVDGLALNPVAGAVMFCAGQIPRARAEIHGAGIVKFPYHARRLEGGEEVHILVVGESARRGSWSAYGYQRLTTPYLNRLQGGAFFLQRAMADANLTSYAVPMILTGMTPEQVTSERPHGTLLDLAKEAGYSTAWLVNQDLDVSTWLGITADRLDYPPDPQASFFGRHTPDDALLPAYRRELARVGASRFIGMHIMESHWEYYRRYPPSFQRFGTASRLNTMSILLKGGTIAPDLTDAYDNSVLYTDWFLEQVIESARRLQVPATVTFIPDHGESLPALDGGAAGHGQPFYNAAQYEIPAFVWVNDAYRAAHPRQVAAVKENATREIHSHDFFYTVADLMGISWPGARPERSFASPQFVPDTGGKLLVGGSLMTRP